MTRVLLLLAAAAALHGQQPAVSTPTSTGPKPLKIGTVTVQGSIRSRLESWDWFQPDAGDPSYTFSGNIFRLSFSQSHETWDWQAELAVPFLLGLPENAVGPGAQGQLGLGGSYFVANKGNRNTAMLFPKQAFIRFLGLGGDRSHTLRIGRFEFMDGSEITPKNATLAAIKRDRINMRLLGHFGWTHTGRSFDGFHYSYSKPAGNFTLIGAIPTRGVFQADGWGENETAFGYAAYSKPWGKGRHSAETRVLALYYHDWRRALKTDNRAVADRRDDTGNIKVATFGGHSLHAVDTKAGGIDMMVWAAGQAGSWGRLDHRAHALGVEAGWQPRFARRLKPWFRGGFFNGSGDGHPTDGTHNTFFQVLPTPRPFARFPFFDLINNRDYLGILILRPHAAVTVSTEFHALSLSNRRDLWYSGGGVFQPWTFGYVGRPTNGSKSLANLYDASLEWRARPNVTFTGYFGYADGRAATQAIYPKGKNGQFGYVEANVRF